MAGAEWDQFWTRPLCENLKEMNSVLLFSGKEWNLQHWPKVAESLCTTFCSCKKRTK